MKNKDLTKGSTGKVLLSFSAPMFLSAVFQQLYSMADSIIAGKIAGKSALAAVGASYPVTMIFMAIALGASVGVSVVISQLFGSENFKGLKTAVSTALISITALSVILTVIGSLSSSAIISVLNTQEDIFAQSDLYLRIYIWGLVFLFVYNACTGIFNALGDSKTPLLLLIGSSLGNIVLDYVFVAYTFKDEGVAGVAWATFIAQGVACIIAFVLLMRRIHSMKIEGGERFSLKMLKNISFIAVPSILQQSFVSIGNLLIQGLVNSYGTDVIAGYSAAVKLNTFTITAFNTMGTAISNFTAQNYGAKKYDRIKKSVGAGYRMALVFAIPCSLLFFFLGRQCIGLFLNSEETAAIAVGVQYLQIVAPFYAVISLKLVCDGILRGTSKIFFFMITTFSDLIIRTGLSFLLTLPVFGLNETGIWLSWPIGWTISTIIAVCLYICVKHRELKETPEKAV